MSKTETIGRAVVTSIWAILMFFTIPLWLRIALCFAGIILGFIAILSDKLSRINEAGVGLYLVVTSGITWIMFTIFPFMPIIIKVPIFVIFMIDVVFTISCMRNGVSHIDGMTNILVDDEPLVDFIFGDGEENKVGGSIEEGKTDKEDEEDGADEKDKVDKEEDKKLEEELDKEVLGDRQVYFDPLTNQFVYCSKDKVEKIKNWVDEIANEEWEEDLEGDWVEDIKGGNDNV